MARDILCVCGLCGMRVSDVGGIGVCDICVCMIWIGMCATWIDVRDVDSCVYQVLILSDLFAPTCQ